MVFKRKYIIAWLVCIVTIASFSYVFNFNAADGVTSSKVISIKPTNTKSFTDNIVEIKDNLLSKVNFNYENTLVTDTDQSVNDSTVTLGSYASCSLIQSPRLNHLVKQEEYAYFTDKFKIDKEPVSSWITKRKQFCDGKITMFDNRFGLAQDIIMFPTRRRNIASQSKGGEQVKEVLDQKLDKEDYNFERGFLEMYCSKDGSKPSAADNFKWLQLINYRTIDELDSKKQSEIGNMTTSTKYIVIVAREDYANLHNWVRNIFNTYIMMIHFNVQPRDVTIMFLDGHPFTNLDKTWELMFGPILRVGHLTKPTVFKNLILSLKENDGPVSNFRNPMISYTEEFRAFVLARHGLEHAENLNCKLLRITIILRRNSVFHPRNVAGNVGRKIFNEAELIEKLMKRFPEACIQGVLMESLPMIAQLEIISKTDVLIGMHGAGMSHTMFLPKHAGVLELFAKGFKNGRPWFECFQAIARWRGLKYDSWENFDAKMEMPHDFTILPVDTIVEKTKGLVDLVCAR